MKMLAPLELGICCGDLDRLLPFYVSVLGFDHVGTLEVTADMAARTGLSVGGYRVARLQTPYGERLKLLEPAEPPRITSLEDSILSRRNATYLTFIVQDLEAMIARLKGAEVAFLKGEEAVSIRPGLRLIFVRDPEGNLLEFVTYDDLASYRPDLEPPPVQEP